MRKLFILLLAITVLASFAVLQKDGDPATSGDVLSEGSQEARDLTVGGKTYRAVWEKVSTDNLMLIPNFKDKKTAADIFNQNECEVLVNGGFYAAGHGSQNEPIGYFISSGEELSVFAKNRLFDGILSVNEMGTPRITREAPEDPLVNAVQSGPIVFENGHERELSLVRDNHARRIVAAVSGENELIFIVFYLENSAFSGPLLEELPQIVARLSLDENLGVADAINLDGGSASAFATAEFNLTEASPVGSFFCAK